jgi:hypothetical protein
MVRLKPAEILLLKIGPLYLRSEDLRHLPAKQLKRQGYRDG